MKKNKMMRLASGLLVAVLLTTSMISGTFAKYVSTATGSDTARVAKWDIDFAGKDVASKDFTFDLFATINDTDGAKEEDVAEGKIIAPGTSGSFEIALVNNSEVNAKYSAAYTVKNEANVPIEFSVDGTNWKADLAELNAKDVAINMGQSASVTVQWRWEFERGEDEADTAFGIKGTDVVKVIADVTVTQVD